MEKDRRDWDLKIIELKDTREFKKAELDQKGRRDDMLFTAPQTIGAALAQGLIDHAKGGGAPIGGGIQGQPGAPQTFKGRTAEGESGEIECPKCHALVGVGPTTTAATCAWCHSQFELERVPAAESPVEIPMSEEEND